MVIKFSSYYNYTCQIASDGEFKKSMQGVYTANCSVLFYLLWMDDPPRFQVVTT